MKSVKLGKEEIQKIVLGVLLGIGVIFGYFEWLLFPLKARHKAAMNSLAALQPAISKAKAQLARDAGVREQAPIAQATLVQIDAMMPEGAPVAWFPPRIAEFFKNRGIDKATTRMVSDTVPSAYPGYRRISWAVDLPKAEFLNFGDALADLENSEPLITIDNITIEALREEPDTQHVILTLVNIVKQ